MKSPIFTPNQITKTTISNIITQKTKILSHKIHTPKKTVTNTHNSQKNPTTQKFSKNKNFKSWKRSRRSLLSSAVRVHVKLALVPMRRTHWRRFAPPFSSKAASACTTNGPPESQKVLGVENRKRLRVLRVAGS